MFGGGPSNLAWFQLGKWSEENARRSKRSAALLWGNRPVEVDQSYIDELHNAHHRASELADHNYKAATDWRNEALGLRVALADREAVIKQTDRNLASCKETLQQERNRYDKKKDTLHSLLLITSSLADAEKAGKGDSPEYQELNLLKDETLAIISHQGNFHRFPEEKHARYIFLIKSLSPYFSNT